VFPRSSIVILTIPVVLTFVLAVVLVVAIQKSIKKYCSYMLGFL